jgi:hypothetical protein
MFFQTNVHNPIITYSAKHLMTSSSASCFGDPGSKPCLGDRLCRLKSLMVFCRFLGSSQSKGKGLPQEAEVAQGVPSRLRPQIFLTFGTTMVLDCQPYASATFTPGEIPGTHF